MSWNLSTGAQKALLAAEPSVEAQLIASTISFGDGDGTGSTDTINDSGSGLGVFDTHDHILIVGGTFNNTLVKAISVAAGIIEVEAGTFTAVAAGTATCLVKISSGALSQVFKNSIIEGRSGVRPSGGADEIESGTLLVRYTKDGSTFVAGSSENGINMGQLSGTTLKRAIDPETGVEEVLRGAGITDGTLGHCRWYGNDYTTGASTTAVRMDGTASTSGADVNVAAGLGIETGVNSEITSIDFTTRGG